MWHWRGNDQYRSIDLTTRGETVLGVAFFLLYIGTLILASYLTA